MKLTRLVTTTATTRLIKMNAPIRIKMTKYVAARAKLESLNELNTTIQPSSVMQINKENMAEMRNEVLYSRIGPKFTGMLRGNGFAW